MGVATDTMERNVAFWSLESWCSWCGEEENRRFLAKAGETLAVVTVSAFLIAAGLLLRRAKHMRALVHEEDVQTRRARRSQLEALQVRRAALVHVLRRRHLYTLREEQEREASTGVDALEDEQEDRAEREETPSEAGTEVEEETEGEEEERDEDEEEGEEDEEGEERGAKPHVYRTPPRRSYEDVEDVDEMNEQAYRTSTPLMHACFQYDASKVDQLLK